MYKMDATKNAGSDMDTKVLDAEKLRRRELKEQEKAVDPARKEREFKIEANRLYDEYEKMCLAKPTILDLDDAYPHSYYWRVGNRYTPGKILVVAEALRLKEKIEDTEAYQRYIEGVRQHHFQPKEWD